MSINPNRPINQFMYIQFGTTIYCWCWNNNIIHSIRKYKSFIRRWPCKYCSSRQKIINANAYRSCAWLSLSAHTAHRVEIYFPFYYSPVLRWRCFFLTLLHARNGMVGLWGFLWWAPSARRKDHHGVSSGWSSVWHRSNTGLSSTQYEQIPIILGVWPFWLTPFFFRSITFWGAYC